MDNLKNSEKLQAVINTLPILNIPATFENVNRMTGIYKILCEVRDSLEAEDVTVEAVEVENDG